MTDYENNKKDLKESLMYKDGMNILAEESLFESLIDENSNTLTDCINEEIKNIKEDDMSAIIEFRNKPIISKLANVESYISESMAAFNSLIFGKKVTLEEAIETAKKFSLVLGENVSYKDIYKNTKLVSVNENIYVEYQNANIGLLDKYKTKLTKRASYCNECLFGDLYDTDILIENIPAIVIAETTLK